MSSEFAKDERFKIAEASNIIGFGCNVCDDWFVPTEKMQYFQALEAHGKHNAERHIHDPSARTVYVYRVFGNSSHTR